LGLIRNSKQVKQAIDFSGVQNGVIHPSDIDAVLEFNNKALVLIEVKRRNNIIPTGQRLMLERIVDRWELGVVLKVEHDFYEVDSDIPLNKCFVTLYYEKSEWKPCNIPVVAFLNQLGNKWNIDKLKNIS
jgi:hypothetical protein